LEAEIWDPVTGNIYPVKVEKDEDYNYYMSDIRLEAYQSQVVVFYNKPKLFRKSIIHTLNQSYDTVVARINGPWTVTFDTVWGGPQKVMFDTLSDWSVNPEEGIRYYSGTATYRNTFNITENKSDGNPLCFLDLGKVKNMARVKLNGHDLGVLWTAPWQVEITGLLKDGENTLEIEIANQWINRLIGDEKEPWDGIENGRWPEWLINGKERPGKRYTFTTHRFYKKDDPLYESGLLGPVMIRTLRLSD
jgi:hypothetical protein